MRVMILFYSEALFIVINVFLHHLDLKAFTFFCPINHNNITVTVNELCKKRNKQNAVKSTNHNTQMRASDLLK